ncbi:MAG TPA: hypothetical protein VGG78_02585, partial [Gemmatimonadaceae bacterium]
MTTSVSHTYLSAPLPHPHHKSLTRRAALAAGTSALLALAACNLGSTTDTGPSLTPASMTVVGGAAQTGAAGNTLPSLIIVRVADAAGASVSGVTVSFTPVTGSGTVNAGAVITDTTGSAGVLWTLGTVPGPQSLTVSTAGLSAVTVTATATAGAPSTITIVSGDAQSAPAGSTLSVPLAVKVVDQFGNAVANANVSWSSDANG